MLFSSTKMLYQISTIYMQYSLVGGFQYQIQVRGWKQFRGCQDLFFEFVILFFVRGPIRGVAIGPVARATRMQCRASHRWLCCRAVHSHGQAALPGTGRQIRRGNGDSAQAEKMQPSSGDEADVGSVEVHLLDGGGHGRRKMPEDVACAEDGRRAGASG